MRKIRLILIIVMFCLFYSTLTYADSYDNLTVSKIYVSDSRVVVVFEQTTGDWQACPSAYKYTANKSYIAALLAAKISGLKVKVYGLTNSGTALTSLIADEADYWAREIDFIQIK